MPDAKEGQVIVKAEFLRELREWFQNDLEAGDDAMDMWLRRLDSAIVFVA